MQEASEEINNENILEASNETNNDNDADEEINDNLLVANETNNDNVYHTAEITDVIDTNISKKDVKETQKLFQLPLSRIKSIMKMDPDLHIVSKDAVFITTKATELFLQCLSKEMLTYTQMGKRKTILKRDLENAIDSISSLCFLEGSLEQLL